jgi:F0F1-type ATP synthase membrane subunit b/b'
LILKLRQAALLAALGICLVGFSSPRIAWSQGSDKAAKEENTENPHEFLYNVINFAILVGALGYILRKPLGEFFISRSASIQKALTEGRKALEASQAQLRAVEEKLKGLEAEIAAYKANAIREMGAERLRIEQSSTEEGARILESARAQMNVAVRAAKLELKRYAAQKSVSLAEEKIRTRLDDSGRKQLVQQFVATIESKERNN